ncbi:MAG: SEC-C domain-containing protein [Xanthomonadaceae bacterium]|nr:SEC-C domain-containing protein [Xanthomonadaceae bacterium]
MKRGRRFVHGDKELVEKLGRNDPCPCGSTRRFKTVLPAGRSFRRLRTPRFLSGIETFERPGSPGRSSLRRRRSPPPC